MVLTGWFRKWGAIAIMAGGAACSDRVGQVPRQVVVASPAQNDNGEIRSETETVLSLDEIQSPCPESHPYTSIKPGARAIVCSRSDHFSQWARGSLILPVLPAGDFGPARELSTDDDSPKTVACPDSGNDYDELMLSSTERSPEGPWPGLAWAEWEVYGCGVMRPCERCGGMLQEWQGNRWQTITTYGQHQEPMWGPWVSGSLIAAISDDGVVRLSVVKGGRTAIAQEIATHEQVAALGSHPSGLAVLVLNPPAHSEGKTRVLRWYDGADSLIVDQLPHHDRNGYYDFKDLDATFNKVLVASRDEAYIVTGDYDQALLALRGGHWRSIRVDEAGTHADLHYGDSFPGMARGSEGAIWYASSSSSAPLGRYHRGKWSQVEHGYGNITALGIPIGNDQLLITASDYARIIPDEPVLGLPGRLVRVTAHEFEADDPLLVRACDQVFHASLATSVRCRGRLETLEEVSKLSDLQSLWVRGLGEFEGVEQLAKLEMLYMEAAAPLQVVNETVSLEILGKLSSLRSLKLGYFRSRLDLAPISRLSKLESLSLHGPTVHAESLAALHNLRRLFIKIDQEQDWSFLSQLPKLETLVVVDANEAQLGRLRAHFDTCSQVLMGWECVRNLPKGSSDD